MNSGQLFKRVEREKVDTQGRCHVLTSRGSKIKKFRDNVGSNGVFRRWHYVPGVPRPLKVSHSRSWLATIVHEYITLYITQKIFRVAYTTVKKLPNHWTTDMYEQSYDGNEREKKKVWGAFGKQRQSQLMWRRVAERLFQKRLPATKRHGRRRWQAVFVGSLTARTKMTGDSGGWSRQHVGIR